VDALLRRRHYPKNCSQIVQCARKKQKSNRRDVRIILSPIVGIIALQNEMHSYVVNYSIQSN